MDTRFASSILARMAHPFRLGLLHRSDLKLLRIGNDTPKQARVYVKAPWWRNQLAVQNLKRTSNTMKAQYGPLRNRQCGAIVIKCVEN